MEDPDPLMRHKRLNRRPGTGFRFLTFSCHRRLPLFRPHRLKDLFALQLAASRQRLGFKLYGWVLMPEHVHLLIRTRDRDQQVGDILRSIKQPVAQAAIARWRELNARIFDDLRVADGRTRFWQAGSGFDRSLRERDRVWSFISYMHENPVKRGLVSDPLTWRWSSALWYEGVRREQVPIDPLRAPPPPMH